MKLLSKPFLHIKTFASHILHTSSSSFPLKKKRATEKKKGGKTHDNVVFFFFFNFNPSSSLHMNFPKKKKKRRLYTSHWERTKFIIPHLFTHISFQVIQSQFFIFFYTHFTDLLNQSTQTSGDPSNLDEKKKKEK